MIALITPTGARPKQIRLCAEWMKRQTYNGSVLWIVVDDAIPITVDLIQKFSTIYYFLWHSLR